MDNTTPPRQQRDAFLEYYIAYKAKNNPEPLKHHPDVLDLLKKMDKDASKCKSFLLKAEH
jgi:hypothetical protein